MHGIELCDEERRTLRPSAPRPVFSPPAGSVPPGHAAAFTSLSTGTRSWERPFAHPQRTLFFTRSIPGSMFPACCFPSLRRNSKVRSAFGSTTGYWFAPLRLLLRLSPFLLPCRASPTAPPDLRSPSGCLLPPDRSVQSSEPPVGPPCKCARFPLAPRLRFYC